MSARFDENPAMTLRVIKETKRYGRTDNVKTVYPLQIKFAGGINITFKTFLLVCIHTCKQQYHKIVITMYFICLLCAKGLETFLSTHNVCFCIVIKNNIFDYANLILSKVLKLSLKELKSIEPIKSQK